MKYYIEDIRAGDSLSFLFFEFQSRSRANRNYPPPCSPMHDMSPVFDIRFNEFYNAVTVCIS